jgi:signal transduction histidine kinase
MAGQRIVTMKIVMKELWLRRPSAALFLLVSYLMWASVTVRWITEFIEEDHPLTWLISGLLLLFGILLGLEPLLTQGSVWRAHLYLAFQTILVFLASLLHFQLDFFALLYLILCGQAFFLFPRRTAMAWAGVLILATVVGQILQFGWPEALSFIFLYTAGLIFIAAFSDITLQAEAARQRSENLLDQLQEVNQQLQNYADQAEKLAVANERNRLARDLHDSVAQTLYGLTLQAEAASRKLSAGQVARVEQDLREIRDSAQQTLQETRLLIFELRPPILQEEGLAAALRLRLAAVEDRSGLKVQDEIEEIGHLPERIETALYRIAQEALNNSMKHAQASRVVVSLLREQDIVRLVIADDGLGFDPETNIRQGGLGLKGMRERAEQAGGSLLIQSQLGQGTSIRVEIPLK